MNQPPNNRSLLQAYRNSRYKPAGPRLPGGTEVVDPKRRYAFEAPWPWYEIDTTFLAGTTALGAPADIALTAPRTDGRDPLLSLLCSEEQLVLEEANPKALMRRYARGSGDNVTSVDLLLVDGSRALLATTHPSKQQDVAFLLLAPRDGILVDGYARVPASQATGYRSHIVSMLASWTWAS